MSSQEPQTNNPQQWFYAPTRQKNDTLQQNYDAKDNQSQQDYYLTTARAPPEPCQNFEPVADFASAFVTMNYTGNYGNTAAGGCDVDLYSRLALGDPGTQRLKGHQQTFARPWATTPNMGGGPSASNKDIESRLIQSAPIRTRKECSTVSDKFFPQQFDPLLQSVRDDMKEASSFVQSWARGGEPTRLVRQKAVLE
jgi:hypothetical protein